MSRRILLLLCPALFSAAFAAGAQSYPNDGFVWQDTHAGYPPEPPPRYIPDMQPTPRFPGTVQLRTYEAHDRGGSFVGQGVVHVFNPHGENFSFRYRCGVAFPAYRPTEFYARWVTPGRKLEILLLKPGTDRTGTCRISVSQPQLVASSSAAGSTP